MLAAKRVAKGSADSELKPETGLVRVSGETGVSSPEKLEESKGGATEYACKVRRLTANSGADCAHSAWRR